MLKPLDDPAHAVALISEVTGSTRGDVAKRLLSEAEEVGTVVAEALAEQQIPRYVISDELNDFYEQSDAFLYETTVWNCCAAKDRMRGFIQNRLERWGRTESDVFCFGDGLGFDSAFLAQCGHRVRYFEPSLRCQRYAQTVFQDNGVSVETLETLDEIAPESLDVVVCLDVLEHIPEPQNMVGQIVRWLRPDGLLFVHAPYWMIHPTRATHLLENRKYSGDWKRVYGVNGLTPIDSSVFWDPIVFQKNSSPRLIKRSLLDRVRVAGGGLLLFPGRWPCPIHTWTARQIARAPAWWVKSLRSIARQST